MPISGNTTRNSTLNTQSYISPTVNIGVCGVPIKCRGEREKTTGIPSDFFRALVSKETWGKKRREKIPPKFPFLEFSHEQRGERGRAVCQRFRALGPKPQADELLMEPGEGECRGAMSEAGCEVVLGNVKVTLNASLLVKSVR